MTDLLTTPTEPSGSAPAPEETGGGASGVDAAALTTGVDYWTTHAIPSIGLRSLRLADGPHGLRVQDDENPDHLGLERSAPATCFPPAVTMASSWDPDLIEAVGTALGREARAAGVDVVLGPGLNIKRGPLCGRNFEYYSEDPLLAGVLAAAAVRGIQSTGVAACLKHFAINNQETDRLRVSAEVDARTAHEIYLRAFQVALRESDPWSIMSAYNRINGVHASENHWLLTEVLREGWGYDGVVVSDWGAVHDPVAAVKAGLDLRMPGRPQDARVPDAATAGTISPTELDQVVKRMLLLAERTSPTGSAPAIDLDAHHDLVRSAAADSAVLLTNNGALPLDPSRITRLAVVGELARTPRYQGAGSSRVNPTRVVSGLESFERRAAEAGIDLEFSPGYALTAAETTEEMPRAAADAAARADAVVVFLGLPGSYEAEGRDRTTIDLPAEQLALLDALSGLDVPVVVALSNGSAVTTAAWRDDVDAICEFWLTGQAHGDTVTDVLLGDREPGGRLTETIPARLSDTPSFLDFPGENGVVRYSEGIHVGYRYYDARDLVVDHPFGHGMSYTTFHYSDLVVRARDLSDPVAFDVEVRVTNTGGRAGSDVVQVYVDSVDATVQTPPRELRGWSKVGLDAGENEIVRIEILRDDLAHWNTALPGRSFEGGRVDVHVGRSSRDLQLVETLELPGARPVIPLDEWSTFGDFLDHPVVGARLRESAARRGGFGGRIGDLLEDEAGRINVLSMPLATIVEFPGIPLEPQDIHDAIEAQFG